MTPAPLRLKNKLKQHKNGSVRGEYSNINRLDSTRETSLHYFLSKSEDMRYTLLFISLCHDLQSLFNLVISLISNLSICYMIENTPQCIKPCSQEKVSQCYWLNMLLSLLQVRLCLVARIYSEDVVLLNIPWPHLTASFTLATSFN